MTPETLALAMFVCLFVFLLLGYPVAFTLPGVALWFAALGWWFDIFYWEDLGFVPSRIFGMMQNITLLAVPLFVFMGLLLEKSGLAEELLDHLAKVFRGLKGAHLYAVILVGALLAASTGIVGATVVTMGVLALPAMLQNNYPKTLASGTIAAAGTLGQIIPPSIILVLLGDIMNVDVGDLFVASMVPGILLVSGYILFVSLYFYFKKTPPQSLDAELNHHPVTVLATIKAIAAPLILLVVVLGSILLGMASPTEAAACGCVGALCVNGWRRQLSRQVLRDALQHSVRITAMVFWILIGAQFFSAVFRGLSGDVMIEDFVMSMNASPGFLLFSFMATIFVLGFFLDFLEICFIIVPIILPILKNLNFNPLWLAILIAVNLQTSFLTPPFGFALFYLKGVAPASVTTWDIYKGVVPFVGIQILVLTIVALFPQLILWAQQ